MCCLFSAGVRDSRFLGLCHHPRHTPDYDAATAARRKRAIEEARRSGNSELDIAAAGRQPVRSLRRTRFPTFATKSCSWNKAGSLIGALRRTASLRKRSDAADGVKVIHAPGADRPHPSSAALVSGTRVQTKAVAHSPTAAKLTNAAPTPRWSAMNPAITVLNVAPPPMARPTNPSEVV